MEKHEGSDSMSRVAQILLNYLKAIYSTLKSQGKTGLQSIEINGEIINVFIKDDGAFDTAYGVYKYTVDDFR